MNVGLSIDFDKEIFLQSFNTEFDSNYSVISNIEVSLKRAMTYFFTQHLPVKFELIFSKFNCEHTTLKELSEKGLYIKDFRFNILFLEDFLFENGLYFSAKSNLKYIDYGLNPTWVSISKQIFKKLYKDKNELCKTDCNKKFLQEYPRNCWDMLILYQCKLCGKLFHCSCQTQAYNILEKYYKTEMPMGSMSKNFITLYSKSKERNNICSLCNNTVPQYNYCHEMYGSKFKSVFGAYIYLEAIKNANKYITEYNDPNFKDYIKRADHYLREKLGYPISGKKWINETYLYNVVKTIFYNHRVEREYSPKWLCGKRIDIFVHDINLAIEYQGEQHYKPVEIFGGEQGLKNTQKRDKEKLQLCKLNNIDLIYFNYNEELNESMVIKKLNKYIN